MSDRSSAGSTVFETSRRDEGPVGCKHPYRTQSYGFEIYTTSYKFRIFEINFSPLYPVSMFFDEGVLEDSAARLRELRIERGKLENQYVVHSDEEFIETLRAVFSNKKVVYLLYKLQQL